MSALPTHCPDWCPVCGAELKAEGWPIHHQHAGTGEQCTFEWDHEAALMRERLLDQAPDMTGWSPEAVRYWLGHNTQAWYVRDGQGEMVMPDDEFVMIDADGNEITNEEWVRRAEAGLGMHVRLRRASLG